MTRDNLTMYNPSTGSFIPFKAPKLAAPSGGRMYRAPAVSAKLTKDEARVLETRPLREYPAEFSARLSNNPRFKGQYIAINAHTGTPIEFDNSPQGVTWGMDRSYFSSRESAIKAAEEFRDARK
jgi:hypothetical protein